MHLVPLPGVGCRDREAAPAGEPCEGGTNREKPWPGAESRFQLESLSPAAHLRCEHVLTTQRAGLRWVRVVLSSVTPGFAMWKGDADVLEIFGHTQGQDFHWGRFRFTLVSIFLPIEAGFTLFHIVFLVPSGLVGFLGRGDMSFSGVSQ